MGMFEEMYKYGGKSKKLFIKLFQDRFFKIDFLSLFLSLPFQFECEKQVSFKFLEDFHSLQGFWLAQEL